MEDAVLNLDLITWTNTDCFISFFYSVQATLVLLSVALNLARLSFHES